MAKQLLISSVVLSTPVLVLIGCLGLTRESLHLLSWRRSVEYSLHTLGIIAALLLLTALSFSPLRRLGWLGSSMMRYRRPVGWHAFFTPARTSFCAVLCGMECRGTCDRVCQSSLHPNGWRSGDAFGSACCDLKQRQVRHLGAKWRVLHQLIYPASGLFLVHHLWQVRADYFEFVLFLCGFSLLFLERLWRRACK